MDIQAVTERLQLLSGETAEQLTRWAPVIASAVRMVELRMFDATDPADERLIHLAAVKALRMLEQSRWFQSGDDVTAFTAGDVTVQQSGQHKASALMLEDAVQAGAPQADTDTGCLHLQATLTYREDLEDGDGEYERTG